MSGLQARLRITDDKMNAFIIIENTEAEDQGVLSEEYIHGVISGAGIKFGVDESAVRGISELSLRDGEVLVASGSWPVNGKDGYMEYYVTKSDEYRPSYTDEENAFVDFKNIDAFQLVTKGQELCRVYPPVSGTDGMNVFGGTIHAKQGKAAASPQGQNTRFGEDGLTLIATVGGSINFDGQVINIKDVLTIRGDVNMASGNVRFEGDVIVEGSVNEGFSVECGGSLTVKGKVINAELCVKKDLAVRDGLTGAKKKLVSVGGSLKCRYIESSILRIKGDIISDYIIDSDVECLGDITLTGRKSLLMGGKTRILGQLTANYIGNEREIHTRLELIETQTNKERIVAVTNERDRVRDVVKTYRENLSKLNELGAYAQNHELDRLHKQLTKQLPEMSGRLLELEAELKRLKIEEIEQYPGSIKCNRIMFPGVDLYAGSLMLPRDQTKLEHCMLYLENGDWVKGLA